MKERAIVLNAMSGGPDEILEKSRGCLIRRLQDGRVQVQYRNSSSEKAMLKLTLTGLMPDACFKVMQPGTIPDVYYANRAGILENRFTVLAGNWIEVVETPADEQDFCDGGLYVSDSKS